MYMVLMQRQRRMNMGMIKCDKGHYYDSNKFFICPQCGIKIELVDIEGYVDVVNKYDETLLMKKSTEIEETILMNK